MHVKRAPRSRLNHLDERAVLEMKESGMDIPAIRNATGRSLTSIYKILRKNKRTTPREDKLHPLYNMAYTPRSE